MKGCELKQLRKDNGLTLSKMAMLTHYTKTYLCYSEGRDELPPKLNKMIELMFRDEIYKKEDENEEEEVEGTKTES